MFSIPLFLGKAKMNPPAIRPAKKVDPSELGRRISTMKQWFMEMQDDQKTVALAHLVVCGCLLLYFFI
jgi:hypothetical protein